MPADNVEAFTNTTDPGEQVDEAEGRIALRRFAGPVGDDPFEKLDLSEVKPGEDPEAQYYYRVLDPEILLNQRPQLPIADPKTGEVLVKSGQRINKRLLKKLENAKVKRLNVTLHELKGRIIARTLYKAGSEEILVPCNTALTAELLTTLVENDIKEVELLFKNE